MWGGWGLGPHPWPSPSPAWPWKWHRVASSEGAEPILTSVAQSRVPVRIAEFLSGGAFYHFTRWQGTNVAEHPSIKYRDGVNTALRDVKSAIFNKDASHQKYLIQSNSLSWAKRNKSLCVSLYPLLKGSRLVRKNGRASCFIDVLVLFYFVYVVHVCIRFNKKAHN